MHTVHVHCYVYENSLSTQYEQEVKALIARALTGNMAAISILKISTYFIIGLGVSIYDTGRENQVNTG